MSNSLSSRFVALEEKDDDEIVVEPDRIVNLCLPPLYRFEPFVVFSLSDVRRFYRIALRVAVCGLRLSFY